MSTATYNLEKDAVRECDTDPLHTILTIAGTTVELTPDDVDRLYHMLDNIRPIPCTACGGTGHTDPHRINGCTECRDTGWVK